MQPSPSSESGGPPPYGEARCFASARHGPHTDVGHAVKVWPNIEVELRQCMCCGLREMRVKVENERNGWSDWTSY